MSFPALLRRFALRFCRQTNQAGYLSIEALFLVLLMGFLISEYAAVETVQYTEREQQAIIGKMERLAEATQAYMASHDLTSHVSTGGPGITIPIKGTTGSGPESLEEAGLIAPGFEPVNAYNHDAYILVKRPGTDRIDVMIVTDGGEPLPLDVMPDLVSQIGIKAGFLTDSTVYTAGSLEIVGAGGAWRSDPAYWESAFAETLDPGRLAVSLAFQDGYAVDDAVYRIDKSPVVEPNTMRADLALCRTTGGGACADVDNDGNRYDDANKITRSAEVQFESLTNEAIDDSTAPIPKRDTSRRTGLTEGVMFSGIYQHGDEVPKPKCPNYKPSDTSRDRYDYARIYVATGAIADPSGRPLRQFSISAYDAGTEWVLHVTTTAADTSGSFVRTANPDASTPHEILAFVRCANPYE